MFVIDFSSQDNDLDVFGTATKNHCLIVSVLKIAITIFMVSVPTILLVAGVCVVWCQGCVLVARPWDFLRYRLGASLRLFWFPGGGGRKGRPGHRAGRARGPGRRAWRPGHSSILESYQDIRAWPRTFEPGGQDTPLPGKLGNSAQHPRMLR